jgi:cell division septation protein DedD
MSWDIFKYRLVGITATTAVAIIIFINVFDFERIKYKEKQILQIKNETLAHSKLSTMDANIGVDTNTDIDLNIEDTDTTNNLEDTLSPAKEENEPVEENSSNEPISLSEDKEIPAKKITKNINKKVERSVWVIQVGIFLNAKNAERLKNDTQKKTSIETFIKKKEIKNKEYSVVYIGSWSTKDKALEKRLYLKEEFRIGGLVVKIKK